MLLTPAEVTLVYCQISGVMTAEEQLIISALIAGDEKQGNVFDATWRACEA